MFFLFNELLVICPEQKIMQLLPPANDVCGKVMFLHLSVSHSVQGLSLYDVTSCLATWSMFLLGGLCLWFHVPSGGSLSLGGGSLSRGWGDLCPGGLCRETPRIRKVGSKHPIGMLSCSFALFRLCNLGFQKCTKLPTLTLMPTSYNHILAISFFISTMQC